MPAGFSMGLVQARVAALRMAVDQVRTAVVEDRPPDTEHPPDHKALDDLCDAVEDLVDAVDEAGSRTSRGAGVETLPHVHRSVLRAGAVLHDDLLRVDGRFDTARRAVRGWGPRWRPWSGVVLTNLTEASDALLGVEHAVADAWGAVAGTAPRSTDPVEQDVEV